MCITELIGHMIVLDNEPLDLVNHVGFRRLINYLEPRYGFPSRSYMTDKIIPQLKLDVRAYLAEHVISAAAISFTTDIWSSDVSPMSLLSLTAHWVDAEFNLKSAVLHAQECRGSHTADMIQAAIKKMLLDWKIDSKKVHVILRDNAANMKKAMDQLQVSSLGCFAHTLQLIVHEGLLSQRAVSDALAKGRQVVGHFKHSQAAYSVLEDLQDELNITPKRLQQDVKTRWSSTKAMIDSLIHQKRAIGAYASEHELPGSLSANEWGLLERTAKVLAPFEELTKQVSAASATAADVIPFVQVLIRFLNKVDEANDHGIKTMKATLLEAVRRRFTTANNDVEAEPLYSLATLLDPRYKQG